MQDKLKSQNQIAELFLGLNGFGVDVQFKSICVFKLEMKEGLRKLKGTSISTDIG